MCPLDPGRHWLEAGITGLARQREWDAVATAEGPGELGDEAEFVALADGLILLETGRSGFDPTILAGALEGSIDVPYRAVAVRREERWAIGACAIDVARLAPDPRADALELTWDGALLTLVADRMPADPSQASALQAIATRRKDGPYAARAQRLTGDLWEVMVLPL
jgi:hypothetical protein